MSCWKCTEIRLGEMAEFYCNQDQDMKAEDCQHFNSEAGTDEAVREELCQ